MTTRSTTAAVVTLVGSNMIFREGLRRILIDAGFDVVRSIDSPNDIVVKENTDGHLIVIDYADRRDGAVCAATLRDLHDRAANARIVVLADHFDLPEMMAAFANGVYGYIVKEMSCDPLIGSLRLVAMGEKVLPSHLVEILPLIGERNASTSQSETARAHLSERENSVLHCLVLGMPNKMISRRLLISEATVKVHVKAILRKLNVHNRTQAAIVAMRSAPPAGEGAYTERVGACA